MLEPLQSQPFRTYAAIVVYTIIFGSHGLIYFLSIVGLLLRPFSRNLWNFSSRQPSSLPASAVVWCVRQPVVFLYPWMRLTAETPGDFTRTPFRPSRLLLIHALWLINSVGFWVGITLFHVVSALNEVFPDVVGLKVLMMHGLKVPAWMVFTVLAMYAGVFALWSSLTWLGSLRRSLAHFRHMNSEGNGGDPDDAGHYLAPFRRATGWPSLHCPYTSAY